MRERLARGFDVAWIDNCNGDKYKTGKRTPSGTPDESMFTTDEHRVGIQVGTAIATLVKRGHAAKPATDADNAVEVHYRDFWGTGNEKRAALLASLSNKIPVPQYASFTPRSSARWVFTQSTAGQSTNYDQWPQLAELFPVHFSGLNENRQGALISDDPQLLERRIRTYLNPNITDTEIAEESPGLMTDAARFDASATRRSLLAAHEQFDPKNLLRLAFRPFDDLWVYWMPRTKLLNEKRVEFREQVWPGNVFLSASQTARKGGSNTPIVVDKFGDLHLQDPWSQFFPLFLRVTGELGGDRTEPNVHPGILEALCSSRDIPALTNTHRWTKEAMQVAELLFWHALAIFWSPAYRRDNDVALRQDWPRIPIPADPAALDTSAALGRAVGDLLLPDRPVSGVTKGKLRPEFRTLAVPSKLDGSPIDPDADLKVEAGWGFRGQKNAVMCGKGKTIPSNADLDAALDIYLNDRVYWANVPTDVWALTIGGYPVLKKWLSYREFKIIGRPLRESEMTYVTEIVRRLKALLLLGDDLDANYRTCAARTLDHIPPAAG